MNKLHRTLLALALTTSLVPAAFAQSSFLQTYDANGFYYTDLQVNADASGEYTGVFVRGGDVGVDAASGQDVTSQLELVSVTAPSGLDVSLDSATATNMASWNGDLVALSLLATTDGTLSNGVYPVVVTLRNKATGETTQFAASVVVTESDS
ncbi:hypothetical protein [Deinococcus yavapaiensis]|uniref:Uncharacterized protein n=1 Tax=Deinococcus yavapaiensis KR-236 TaxID=694435 RepID=A0A318SJJ6_9DEIO|nr:hypothetical protein [Deinococcus yavapaiensis]PYE52738.1 hypothetical protein DES52_11259 [Deinococcus yavapaiensis KR-236]